MKIIKKLKFMTLAATLVVFSGMASTSLHAYDFEGNEEEWKNKCKLSQSSEEDQLACIEFTQFRLKKHGTLQSEANNLSAEMKTIQNDINALSELVKKQQTYIDSMNDKIAENEATIAAINILVEDLGVQIEEKKASIERRDKTIQSRMISEQSKLGTNIQIEIIMGSSDLIDMISRAQGIQKITERDQDEIKKITKEKEELDLQMKEQVRLKEETETTKKENETNKLNAEAVQAEQKQLINTFQQQEASLQEKMRSVQVDMGSIRQNIIDINLANGGDISFGATGMIRPVNGPVTATPWYYGGGGAHLGLDIAPGIGSPIVAPAEGIILYASNPVATNSGYLGNWSGHPQGAGNSICMVTQVNGITYSITFAHMRQENFLSSPGQYVFQGQKLGEVGNSGNTTGPHCHIEVFNLGSMSVNDAIRRFAGNADFAWGNGWGEGAVNRRCGISAPPCREQPQSVF